MLSLYIMEPWLKDIMEFWHREPLKPLAVRSAWRGQWGWGKKFQSTPAGSVQGTLLGQQACPQPHSSPGCLLGPPSCLG